jgi:hypothetical protein
MPIKRAFYVEDFGEVLRGLPGSFSTDDFYIAVMATIPAKGPQGEDTTTDDFSKEVKRAVGNWVRRKANAGRLKRGKRTGWRVTYTKPTQKAQPAAPKKPAKAPEAPQESLTLLEIGKGINALIAHLTEDKDVWLKKYHDLLGAYEKLQGEMRDLKVDKENLNRKLDRQNTEILRLTNEHKVSGQSSVKLKDVARFKTKNRGAGL